MFEYSIGFAVGAVTMLCVINIMERENHKKRLAIRAKTRLYHYDLRKKRHLPDCSQKRRG